MTMNWARLMDDGLGQRSLAYRPVRARLVDAGSTGTIEVAIGIWVLLGEVGVEQQNLHKAVACHTLSLPLLFTEVLVLQVLRTNPSEVY